MEEEEKVLTSEEIKYMIENDFNFINSKKYKYNFKDFLENENIKKMLENHPNGIQDQIIARLLNIKTEEVKVLYEGAIKKLRKTWGISEDNR